MEKYFGSVITQTGTPIVGAVVTVTHYGTGLPATLYIDDGITPITGPLLSDATGFYEFFITPGHYNLTYTLGGDVVRTILDVTIGDDNPVIVNVKDYGAVGNGSTDDTSKIQAAISANYGGNLYFPPGTYIITSALLITAGIRLYGVPGYSTLKVSSTDRRSINLIDTPTDLAPVRQVNGLTIDGLVFDGASVGVNRWLQKWSDQTAISDPENDYFAAGGGIGNPGANYIADDDYIAAAQSGTSGSPLTLAATTMPATQSTSSGASGAYSRRLRIVSSGDDSGVTFAVVGTDYSDAALTESITGANAGTAEGTKGFKTVTSVTPSANTAGNVSVGIEEFDIFSTVAADRRNPEYGDVNSLLRIRTTENTAIRNCRFINHFARIILEQGGLNVLIEDCTFENVGKDDGPFPAIYTQSFGSPASPPASFTDSENIIVRRNYAKDIERSFLLFGSTKGGIVKENTIDGWGESCIFVPSQHHYNGGSSVIRDNVMRNGTLTDIAGQGIEAGGITDTLIVGNTIESSAENAMTLTGAQNVTVSENRMVNCYTATVTPYGPFSERFGFNIGEAPIAGDAITGGSYIKIGNFGNTGNKNLTIRGNHFEENRGTYPSVFAQSKTTGSSLSKDVVIEGNQLNIPAAMTFYDASTTNVFASEMSLWIRNNIGHASEAPVIIDDTYTSASGTGARTITPGFRPSLIEVFGAESATTGGRGSVGRLSWHRSGVRNDFAWRVTAISTQRISISDNDMLLIRDGSNTDTFKLEFSSWDELGFVVNVQTITEDTLIRYVCHP